MILVSYQYEITDWMELNESLFKAILIEKAVMTGLLFFVVLIAIFNIMVMISMTIENKKGYIASLKSLWYNQKDVTQIFLIQGFIANIVGIVFGLILSLLVLYNLVYIEEISRNIFNFDFFPPGLYILDSMPYVIKLSEFVWICIATILIGMMASYFPSRITSGYSVPDLMRLYRSWMYIQNYFWVWKYWLPWWNREEGVHCPQGLHSWAFLEFHWAFVWL